MQKEEVDRRYRFINQYNCKKLEVTANWQIDREKKLVIQNNKQRLRKGGFYVRFGYVTMGKGSGEVTINDIFITFIDKKGFKKVKFMYRSRFTHNFSRMEDEGAVHLPQCFAMGNLFFLA